MTKRIRKQEKYLENDADKKMTDPTEAAVYPEHVHMLPKVTLK